MDDQLTGLVVKGELAEVLHKNGGRKQVQNFTGRVKSRTNMLERKRRTDHATCKVVVLPGGVDNGAVLVKSD